MYYRMPLGILKLLCQDLENMGKPYHVDNWTLDYLSILRAGNGDPLLVLDPKGPIYDAEERNYVAKYVFDGFGKKT